MKITLDALIVLDAIARKGSFAAAADELHRVPSAVSYTVQKLEQDLDTEIFDRSGHRAVLTPSGKELLEQGRHLLVAAQEIEARVKRVAKGWETELRIAIDSLIPSENLFPVIERFYETDCGTQLRVHKEVLGGTWEALLNNRVDLIIGATGDSPSTSKFTNYVLGHIEMVFAVAPHHTLASAEEPISKKTIQQYRAIAIADSSRHMAPRTAELLTDQDVLTVPDMATKVQAHCHGLGVGTIPRTIAEKEQRNGRLIIKQCEGETVKPTLVMAWPADNQGKALLWFVNELKKPEIALSLLQ
ncbi:MAG: LysR family transcriptional regulator [Gammaproteobacteria bacterium SG8_11]|nr:MAG: LysR family transcriptional regulator [Gammaproteobacteria bacterium SG8_11]